MRKNVLVSLVMIAHLATSGAGISVLEEVQITSESTYQQYPIVYGTIVVWDEWKHGGLDICGYDLSTQEEFAILHDGGGLSNSALCGDIVVWQDTRNGNYDIYGYDLSTAMEFQISSNDNHQTHPAIYGDIVVYEESRNGNWDICGYNLSTGTEFQITTDSHDQYDPAIYGIIVVWNDKRNGNSDIYGYNLSTGTEFQITNNTRGQIQPAIYGDIVVWQDMRNWDVYTARNWDIYGYDLLTGTEFQITTDEHDQTAPAIYGGIVVWDDLRNTHSDIYGYNLLTGTEFQITTDEHDQSNPALYGNTVVWMDERNGNSDIYGVILDVDAALLISQEADFFFDKGVKALENKNYEMAVDLFQLAKEKYINETPEKASECDRLIQLCEAELKKRGYVKVLLFLAVACAGGFGLIREYQTHGTEHVEKAGHIFKEGNQRLKYGLRKMHKRIWVHLEPQARPVKRPLGLGVITVFWGSVSFVMLVSSAVSMWFYNGFLFYENLSPSLWGLVMLAVLFLEIGFHVFLIFSCYGLWIGRSWSYPLFFVVVLGEITCHTGTHVLGWFTHTAGTAGYIGISVLTVLLLGGSFLYVRTPRVKEYLGISSSNT